MAQVDRLAILAQITLKRIFRGIDPVCSLDLLRVELSQGVGTTLEMVLNYHLIVDLVLRFDKLAFSMLNLQVKHVHIFRFRKVPIQVLLHLFDRLSNHVAIRVETDRLDWVKVRLAQKFLQKWLCPLRSCRAPELLEKPLHFESIFIGSKEVRDVEGGRVSKNFRALDDFERTNDIVSAELRHQEGSV